MSPLRKLSMISSEGTSESTSGPIPSLIASVSVEANLKLVLVPPVPSLKVNEEFITLCVPVDKAESAVASSERL